MDILKKNSCAKSILFIVYQIWYFNGREFRLNLDHNHGLSQKCVLIISGKCVT